MKHLTLITSLFVWGSVMGQDTLYQEQFNTNDLTCDNPSWATNWSLPDDFFRSENSQMQAKDLDYESGWYSTIIDISQETNVTIKATFDHSGAMSSAEYIRGYYVLDGGSEVLWIDHTDDNLAGWPSGNPSTDSVTGISGNTLEVIIKAYNTGASDIYIFDDVVVTGDINGVLFSEPFNTNGLTCDFPAWCVNYPDNFMDHFQVVGNKMEAADVDGIAEGVWYSKEIDITSHAYVKIKVDFEGVGLDSVDYCKGFYVLDGGSEVQWYTNTGDFSSADSVSGLSGSTLQVIIRVMSGSFEYARFDNVMVSKSGPAGLWPFYNPTLGRVEIYPNPFTDRATLEIRSQNTGVSSLRVYSLNGQLVREKAITNQTSITLDRGNLPSGMYFVEVIGEDGVIGREKVVIAN